MIRGLIAALLLVACAAAPVTEREPPAVSGLASATRDFDGDGLVDPRDRCPRDPGEGPLGCPEPDDDGDGFKDRADRCRQEPGMEPDGCPIADGDGDGILDRDDRCATPETKNGYLDEDGCPDDIPRDLAEFVGAIAGVEFVADTRVLTPRAVRVLGRAAQALRRHATVRIEIVGHLHGGWPLQYGRDPSSVRASEVKRVLVEHGVEAARIEVRGAGPDEPINSNRTAAGRARNERIEFTLLVQ